MVEKLLEQVTFTRTIQYKHGVQTLKTHYSVCYAYVDASAPATPADYHEKRLKEKLSCRRTTANHATKCMLTLECSAGFL